MGRIRRLWHWVREQDMSTPPQSAQPTVDTRPVVEEMHITIADIDHDLIHWGRKLPRSHGAERLRHQARIDALLDARLRIVGFQALESMLKP